MATIHSVTDAMFVGIGFMVVLFAAGFAVTAGAKVALRILKE